MPTVEEFRRRFPEVATGLADATVQQLLDDAGDLYKGDDEQRHLLAAHMWVTRQDEMNGDPSTATYLDRSSYGQRYQFLLRRMKVPVVL